MNEHTVAHEECPHCGEQTEFVQFATGEEETVDTDPEEVGYGLLELRSCDSCRSGIEIVLEPARSRVISHN